MGVSMSERFTVIALAELPFSLDVAIADHPDGRVTVLIREGATGASLAAQLQDVLNARDAHQRVPRANILPIAETAVA